MNIMPDVPEVNGKVVLLYQATEEPSIEAVKDILVSSGILPIACQNPNNFRFVVPEIVAATHVDLIGRLALQAFGSDKPLTTFALSVRAALAPPATPIADPSKRK